MAFFKVEGGLLATGMNVMDAPDARGRDATQHDYAHDDAFDLPQLDAFPFGDAVSCESAPNEPFHGEHDGIDDDNSVHSAEFVDAEAFMEAHQPGEDSFLRETTGGNASAAWSECEEQMPEANGEDARRASEIFVPKSRNMENVEFSSPKPTQRKSISVYHGTPGKSKPRTSLSYGFPTAAFSKTSDTVASSEFEIHVDNRLVLTPNSFKYLQSQQRERMTHAEFQLSRSKASSTDAAHESHSVHAKQVVEAQASQLNVTPTTTATRPSSVEKAMHAGPAVIKKALHEIEAMLQPPELEEDEEDPESDTDPALEKLKVRLRQFALPPCLLDDNPPVQDECEIGGVARAAIMEEESKHVTGQAKSEGVQAEFAQVQEVAVQTDSYRGGGPQHIRQASSEEAKEACEEDDVKRRDDHRWERVDAEDPESVRSTRVGTPKAVAASIQIDSSSDDHNQSLEAERTRPRDEKPLRPTGPRRGTSFRTAALRQSLDVASRKQARSEKENQDDSIHGQTPSPVRRELSALRKTGSASRDGHRSVAIDSEGSRALPLATALPSQMARRCRRFLCSVGERMSEQIVFTNGSSKVGRICVSTLPLSTGCQQFSVSPAVLELPPFSKSAFLVTFSATLAGVVAGIFQFRAVGVDCLYEPYEVLIEASVRGDLQLPPHPQEKPSKPLRAPPRTIQSSPKASRVTELPPPMLGGVEITPTFLRFTASPRNTSNQQEVEMPRLFVRVTNTTEETHTVRVKCSHEHLQLTPLEAIATAGSAIEIEVIPLCRPFGRDARGREDWCGTLSVSAGAVQREVSVVMDRRCMALLPSFDDLARVRQAISTQTDSFYFTKKVNRRGLYFHARAVECGSCVVGESHQVPVYICNGSDAPMTVFLQSLQDPFSCSYQPTTLQARKFIEVPIVFTPKAVGKVATCLVAYTVSGKAAVTLIARGVDKPVSRAVVEP